MKFLLSAALFISTVGVAQTTDKQQIEKACLGYLEGFYEGDSLKLIASLKPSLYKIGYWKNEKTAEFAYDGQMTYREAIAYSAKVLAKKHFAKADAVKKVDVLDIMETTACAKVTAFWGYDYLLLSKQNNKWMIEEVLWEGPLRKK